MKKLILAALVAGSMAAIAAEGEAKTEATPVAAETVKKAPKRVQMTDERRAQLKTMRDQRRAAMEAKLVDVIKKYGLDDEKAKALLKELQDAMMPARRNMMRKAPKPAADKTTKGES